MALSGKKITELNPISDVTNKTVLPAVYVDDTYTEATATKVTVQQLKNNILNGAVLQPNIITDTESASIELNKILANTIYQYGTLSSLSITTFDTSYQDSYIYFKTSENGFNFSFSTANWINLYEPTFKLNTDYIIHLKNGVCVLEQPENPILNITATSGNIILRTNTVNSMSISGNTTFVLPQTVNNNILNKIILQIKITGTPTIDWGTTHYLVDSFTLTPNTYDIVYEYDSLNNYWKVGLLYNTNGDGGTVDQTYDSTSTNAQSGTAVAEAVAPALKNLATGSNSINILGGNTLSSTNSIAIGYNTYQRDSSVAIGYSARPSDTYSVAVGASSAARQKCTVVGCGAETQSGSQESIAIGYAAKTSAATNIQLGSGTNSTANTFQVFNYQMLDGTTGKIPMARLPIVPLTQADYDALVSGGTVDANTIYCIIPA